MFQRAKYISNLIPLSIHYRPITRLEQKYGSHHQISGKCSLQIKKEIKKVVSILQLHQEKRKEEKNLNTFSVINICQSDCSSHLILNQY